MKTILFSLIFGSLSAFAQSKQLNCRVQMFYPLKNCGNCQTLDRNFALKDYHTEQINTNTLTDSPKARDKRIVYTIHGDSNVVHYNISIIDLKTGYTSVTQASYLDAKNGVFANIGDNTGLYFTLICK